MVEDTDVEQHRFGDRNWNEVEYILNLNPTLRLPDIGEAIMMYYEEQAIWISDKINDKNCVMDSEWGIQCVENGSFELILVERN